MGKKAIGEVAALFKAYRVIDSCRTPDHWMQADKYCDFFVLKYGRRFARHLNVELIEKWDRIQQKTKGGSNVSK